MSLFWTSLVVVAYFSSAVSLVGGHLPGRFNWRILILPGWYFAWLKRQDADG